MRRAGWTRFEFCTRYFIVETIGFCLGVYFFNKFRRFTRVLVGNKRVIRTCARAIRWKILFKKPKSYKDWAPKIFEIKKNISPNQIQAAEAKHISTEFLEIFLPNTEFTRRHFFLKLIQNGRKIVFAIITSFFNCTVAFKIAM